jgi:osmotically inducible protein OsmC
VITFDKVEPGWRITNSDLTVRGTVPGIDAARFTELAEEAKVGCPISNALKGNVTFSVDAQLEG